MHRLLMSAEGVLPSVKCIMLPVVGVVPAVLYLCRWYPSQIAERAHTFYSLTSVLFYVFLLLLLFLCRQTKESLSFYVTALRELCMNLFPYSCTNEIAPSMHAFREDPSETLFFTLKAFSRCLNAPHKCIL